MIMDMMVMAMIRMTNKTMIRITSTRRVRRNTNGIGITISHNWIIRFGVQNYKSMTRIIMMYYYCCSLSLSRFLSVSVCVHLRWVRTQLRFGVAHPLCLWLAPLLALGRSRPWLRPWHVGDERKQKMGTRKLASLSIPRSRAEVRLPDQLFTEAWGICSPNVGQLRSSPRQPGVSARDAWRATFLQPSGNLSLPAKSGLYRAAGTTVLSIAPA